MDTQDPNVSWASDPDEDAPDWVEELQALAAQRMAELAELLGDVE